MDHAYSLLPGQNTAKQPEEIKGLFNIKCNISVFRVILGPSLIIPGIIIIYHYHILITHHFGKDLIKRHIHSKYDIFWD